LFDFITTAGTQFCDFLLLRKLLVLLYVAYNVGLLVNADNESYKQCINAVACIANNQISARLLG